MNVARHPGPLSDGGAGRALGLEAVADTPHGDDVGGFGRIQLDLLPQALDVGVESAAVTFGAIAPDLLHALLAGDDVPGLGYQKGQQVELLAGQVDGIAPDRGLPQGEIDA